VRDAAAKMRIAAACAKIMRLAGTPGIAVDTLTTQADSEWFKATERAANSTTHVRQAVDSFVDALLSDVPDNAIPILISRLDEMLGGGLRDGELIVIAGNDGMGKTSLLLSLVLNVLMGGYTVLHGTGEVKKPEIVRRFLTMLTGITDKQMRARQVPADKREAVASKAELIKGFDYHIEDSYARFKVNHLRRDAQRIIAEGGHIDLIVCDGIWLMDCDEDRLQFKPRNEQVGYITAALKTLAVDFKCPVIAMQQYNAELYKRMGSGRKIMRPTTHDIAESAAVRRDAHIIWGMHRPSFYDPDAIDENGTELVWLKYRGDSSVRKGDFVALDFRRQYSMYTGFEDEDRQRFDALRIDF
jgi:replicative DNA helicase